MAEIPGARRLRELEFCFPLGRVAPGPLHDLLARHGLFGQRLEPEHGGFSFEPFTGVLKGFIDLVCEWQGKFYILDWKSNWLGNRVEDYGPGALREEILRRHYFFQYQLYTVALDKYLRLRLPRYDYERHFGGVFYVFLRGVDPARPGLGIFQDRPGEALVRELAALLGEAERAESRGV